VSNKQLSNLKRFGGFEALHQLGKLDDDDGDDNHDSNDESENQTSLRLTDLQTERSLANRTLDQTIDEIEVDIEKINGSFGFNIQVLIYPVNKIAHSLKECVFVNSNTNTLLIKNTLLQTAFMAILPTEY